MSLVHEKIRIGVVENGTTKFVSNLAQDLTYTLVDSGGDEFTGREGVEKIQALKEAEPEKTFIAVA